MANLPEEILRIIGVRYPGVVVLTPAEALVFDRRFHARNPDDAAAQRIARGTYPFPLVKRGRNWGVLVTDLANALAELSQTRPNEQPKRGPGRPRTRAGGAR